MLSSQNGPPRCKRRTWSFLFRAAPDTATRPFSMSLSGAFEALAVLGVCAFAAYLAYLVRITLFSPAVLLFSTCFSSVRASVWSGAALPSKSLYTT